MQFVKNIIFKRLFLSKNPMHLIVPEEINMPKYLNILNYESKRMVWTWFKRQVDFDLMQ